MFFISVLCKAQDHVYHTDLTASFHNKTNVLQQFLVNNGDFHCYLYLHFLMLGSEFKVIAYICQCKLWFIILHNFEQDTQQKWTLLLNHLKKLYDTTSKKKICICPIFFLWLKKSRAFHEKGNFYQMQFVDSPNLLEMA